MNKKILVVDDCESIKEILNLILKTLGYNVFPADDWGEAVDLLQNEDFNILFTDFRMPAMRGINNGIELIRFIKLNRFNLRMKIILMSAEMDENIKLVALAAGADIAVEKFEICSIDTMRTLLKNLLIYF